MDLIFAPSAAMVGSPWIAGVVGALFGLAYLGRRQRPLAGLAILWGCYCAYEYGMKLRVLCSGECNIRIDLLLVWPLLLVATVAGLWRARRRAPAARG